MTRPVIIAIPARNEAEHIVGCLQAIAKQPGAHRHIASVNVFANNCTDDTLAAARSVNVPFPLTTVSVELPSEHAHIGYARRGATESALDTAHTLGLTDAIIAGTDADSRVSDNWLSALLDAFEEPIDAVCGAIDLQEPMAPALEAKFAMEAAYADVVARATHLLDPLPHDPWPKHIWCWGANFTVRAETLAAVGGSPLVDLAEDRALHAELLRSDARVRHSTTVRVTTSSRQIGRAPGGFADLIRQYAEDPSAYADYFLEPARLAIRRARRRGQIRGVWEGRRGFGDYWTQVEARDARLTAQRVLLSDLRSETSKLKRWLNIATGRCEIQGTAVV